MGRSVFDGRMSGRRWEGGGLVQGAETDGQMGGLTGE